MVTTSTCICLEKKRWESRKNNITVNHALFDYSFPNQPKEWKHRPAAEDFNWVRKPWILVYFYFFIFYKCTIGGFVTFMDFGKQGENIEKLIFYFHFI